MIKDLICVRIVGIVDPLRSDVKEAVKYAQGAGVVGRMVTGYTILYYTVLHRAIPFCTIQYNAMRRVIY